MLTLTNQLCFVPADYSIACLEIHKIQNNYVLAMCNMEHKLYIDILTQKCTVFTKAVL